MVLALLIATACLTAAWSSVVPIATFDGAPKTTLHWQTVNDPVMGGQSISSFNADSTRKLGVWKGEVKIVPFLHAPGFCNLQSPGLYKTATFPDLSGMEGLVARVREADASGLTHFNMMLMTKGARHLLKQGVYQANFSVTLDMADQFVPWSAFKCTWRGQHVSWCPELSTQLGQITNVGFGTAFPGKAGPFTLEMESLSSRGGTIGASNSIDLAGFDGMAMHKWHSENDPVMGGQSSSSFTVTKGSDGNYGDYQGTCRIVPSLKAPGFTIAMTEAPLMGHFPDVSSMDGLTLGVRVAGGNVSDFKVAFCDSRINWYRCQFKSFKADFSVSATDEFQDVFVPWSGFSDKWDPATGKHTSEDPPKAASLKTITQLQLWVEGVAGDFHLQIRYIRATMAPGGSRVIARNNSEVIV